MRYERHKRDEDRARRKSVILRRGERKEKNREGKGKGYGEVTKREQIHKISMVKEGRRVGRQCWRRG